MISKVKIGGYTYKINLKPKEEIIINKVECRGAIHFETLEIDIQQDLCNQRKLQTLFHEIQHGLDEFYRINYKSTEEEEIDEILANVWSQIFIDNPELVNFIKEVTNEQSFCNIQQIR